jgi:hypothetical protein
MFRKHRNVSAQQDPRSGAAKLACELTAPLRQISRYVRIFDAGFCSLNVLMLSLCGFLAARRSPVGVGQLPGGNTGHVAAVMRRTRGSPTGRGTVLSPTSPTRSRVPPAWTQQAMTWMEVTSPCSIWAGQAMVTAWRRRSAFGAGPDACGSGELVPACLRRPVVARSGNLELEGAAEARDVAGRTSWVETSPRSIWEPGRPKSPSGRLPTPKPSGSACASQPEARDTSPWFGNKLVTTTSRG